MTKINQIWEQLENDPSFSHGLLFRRYSGSVLPDVFVAIQNPEKCRCIAASISNTISVDLSSFISLKDINVELTADENRPGKSVLLFKLLNNQHREIFSVLCVDLIESISNTTGEAQLVKELLDRFEEWKSLFDRAVSQGLSTEEQRGLFGELFFLRKFLQQENPNFSNIINSWVGCEKAVRDFHRANWSVEVKTTSGNNHQKIHISSERQLDTSNLEYLFLYHISLDARQQSGETLNQMVDSILGILAVDSAATNRFRNKLLSGGYFDHHRHLYASAGYFIRDEAFYRVENNFPRIEEKDVRAGVGEVKYSIITSGCSGFIKPEQEVFKVINLS